MKRYFQLSRILSICLLLLISAGSFGFPTENGQRSKYDFSIEMGRAHLSGILVIMKDNGDIRGSLVNEFGISALDFVYNGKKVEIISIMAKLDKWYIKKLLKKDMVRVLSAMSEGQSRYRNEKRKIEYTFAEI